MSHYQKLKPDRFAKPVRFKRTCLAGPIPTRSLAGVMKLPHSGELNLTGFQNLSGLSTRAFPDRFLPGLLLGR